MSDDTRRLEIDWFKTVGGALAAVSTAVLLSTLGAAGTLIGAAVGSVAVTVSTQLYAQGLARSRATVARAQEAALSKVGIAQAEVRRAGRRQSDEQALEAHLDHADEKLAEAQSDLHPAEATTPSLRDRFVLLPWKRIALLAVATFVVVLVVIGGFERLTGRSVSSYTGGSDRDSGSIVPGGPSSDRDDRAPRDDNNDGDVRDPEASDDASPSDDATPSETPTPDASDAPGDVVTPTPSATASASSTPAPVPTPSPTP